MYKTKYGDKGLIECEAISDDLILSFIKCNMKWLLLFYHCGVKIIIIIEIVINPLTLGLLQN